ncbi:MAG: DUF2520 domain-containing protein [Dehalococcoidia bacterium]|nr:DUF2520 domain-containing protein [Dehalococcoidia bacterium]
MRIGFIGAGVVGTALARALNQAGYTVVAAASRRFESAQRLAESVPGCAPYPELQAAADASDLVFVTTRDDAVEAVARSVRWRRGQMVVYTSGATTVSTLAAAKEAGAQTAGFHPLQTFANAEQALANLPGTTFVLEGEGEVMALLEKMAEDLGGRHLTLRSEDKVLYHAAAVVTSNYTVTLMQMAADLWRAFGVETDVAVQALLPLLKGTVRNIEAVGLPRCLTGPVARGDIGTIRAHLQAMEERAPELLPAYRELALRAIPIGIAKGTLDPAAAEALRETLKAHDAD